MQTSFQSVLSPPCVILQVSHPRMSSIVHSLMGQLLKPKSLPLPGLPSMLPSLLPGLRLGGSITFPWSDNGIVWASVPKKKVSYSRRRMRQLASDKHIKPLRNLNRCPSCGHYKRAHTLCMNCVTQIQNMWKAEAREKEEEYKAAHPEKFYQETLDPVDKRFLYPEKRLRAVQKTLKDKSKYLYKRPVTLLVEPKKQPKKKVMGMELKKPFKHDLEKRA
jgi:large subunit ribosomal protein L32